MKSLKDTILESGVPRDKTALCDLWDKAVEYIGETEMLDAIFQAFSADEAAEMLEWLDQQYDLGFDDEEDEED